MGFPFHFQDFNLLAYLTSPKLGRPPRITFGQLDQFLYSLSSAEPQAPPVFATDEDWISAVRLAADRAHDRLFEKRKSLGAKGTAYQALVPETDLIRILEELHILLRRGTLYAFGAGDPADAQALENFAREAMRQSPERLTIFFLPKGVASEQPVDTFDPSPGVDRLLRMRYRWPGILFWSESAESSYCELDSAPKLYQRLLSVLRFGCHKIDAVLREWQATAGGSPETSSVRPKRLLHLSDLHFGTDEALRVHRSIVRAE